MEEISKKDIGKRISERRKQLKLTQEQVAEMSGLSHQFFSCIESGLKNMRAENVIKVCEALKVSTDYILTGKINNIDINYINSMLSVLNEEQMYHMEEIIKNYILGCGYNINN